MESRICIYSKYGKCKKQNCKFYHPDEICCDKTCDIKYCVKKHPQDCRYFWVFNSCRNNGSCKFQHEKPDTLSNAHEKKIDTLENEIKTLRRLHENQDQVISVLKDQLQNQAQEIKNLQSEVLFIQNTSKRKRQNDVINDVTVVNDDNMRTDVKEDSIPEAEINSVKRKKMKRLSFYNGKVPLDQANDTESLDMTCSEEDYQYQEILKYEYRFAKKLEKDIVDIKENVKGRLIDETKNKLNDLKENVKNTKIELKNKIRDSRFENNDNYLTMEVLDNFIKMVENLESIPKNKFRKIAEKDLNEFLYETEVIHQNRQCTLNFDYSIDYSISNMTTSE